MGETLSDKSDKFFPSWQKLSPTRVIPSTEKFFPQLNSENKTNHVYVFLQKAMELLTKDIKFA